jgi:hypothetical protein
VRMSPTKPACRCGPVHSAIYHSIRQHSLNGSFGVNRSFGVISVAPVTGAKKELGIGLNDGCEVMKFTASGAATG